MPRPGSALSAPYLPSSKGRKCAQASPFSNSSSDHCRQAISLHHRRRSGVGGSFARSCPVTGQAIAPLSRVIVGTPARTDSTAVVELQTTTIEQRARSSSSEERLSSAPSGQNEVFRLRGCGRQITCLPCRSSVAVVLRAH